MTGNELKVWRVARGMTQAQCAKLINVSRETIVRWEKGQHSIPADALAKLEAQSPGIKALEPAEAIFARFRPYPWGNRDYTLAEHDKLSIGTLFWRLVLADAAQVWTVRKICARGGFSHHGNDIKLPAGAFPDPQGKEASWARAMFQDAENREFEQEKRLEAALRKGMEPD